MSWETFYSICKLFYVLCIFYMLYWYLNIILAFTIAQTARILQEFRLYTKFEWNVTLYLHFEMFVYKVRKKLYNKL